MQWDGHVSRAMLEKCTSCEFYLSPKFHFVYLFINQMRDSTKKHTILTSFANALTVIEVLKDLKLNQMLTITERPTEPTEPTANATTMPKKRFLHDATWVQIMSPGKPICLCWNFHWRCRALCVNAICFEHFANKHHRLSGARWSSRCSNNSRTLKKRGANK